MRGTHPSRRFTTEAWWQRPPWPCNRRAHGFRTPACRGSGGSTASRAVSGRRVGEEESDQAGPQREHRSGAGTASRRGRAARAMSACLCRSEEEGAEQREGHQQVEVDEEVRAELGEALCGESGERSRRPRPLAGGWAGRSGRGLVGSAAARLHDGCAYDTDARVARERRGHLAGVLDGRELEPQPVPVLGALTAALA